MYDDWYRGPYDGAYFGVVDASRLRPTTTPRRISKTKLIIKRHSKIHWRYNGKTVCGINGRMSLDLDNVTCKRCLRGFREPF